VIFFGYVESDYFDCAEDRFNKLVLASILRCAG